MKWICVGAGIVVFILIVISLWIKKEERESQRMEGSHRKWKIYTGLDPTYDEHGRLRK